MRIGIGLNLLRPETGGAANYVLTLLRHWPQFAPEHPLVLFSFDHNEPLLAQIPPAARQHEIRLRVQEDVAAHLGEIDVYFCPFSSLWPRPLPLPTVLTFHDMQERFFPQFFTPAQLQERFFHYDWSLRMADAVIAVSEFTRQSCLAITGTSGRKVRTIHHAPDELPPPMLPAGWDPAGWDRFVFYPANFWDHKNHAALLRALGQLRAAGSPVRCVFTGDLLGREDAWNALVADAGVESLVRHLGRRPRAEVSWLFHHARALVFPSQFEGFGIPVIEAMHAGCPVACSCTTSLPEIAGDSALYFAPEKPDEITATLARLWHDDDLCSALAAKGRARADSFTAERLVREHVAAFDLARRRYHPWQHWYRRRILQPRSAVPRFALQPREIAAAQQLLQRSRVNSNAT